MNSNLNDGVITVTAVRIALITDIHEDVVSLTKALRIIDKERCDQIVCLGDVVGFPFKRALYGETRDASVCIDLLRKYCSVVVAGNHDIFHMRRFPESKAGFRFPHNWYVMTPDEKTTVSKGRVWNYSDDYPVVISDSEREYLNSLPESVCIDAGGVNVLLAHYIYPDFTGYVLSKRGYAYGLRSHFDYMTLRDCDVSICGHMHNEGLGIAYQQSDFFGSRFFDRFVYYRYGVKGLKYRRCCVAIPALADNGQINGFAIYDSTSHIVEAVALNNRRRYTSWH